MKLSLSQIQNLLSVIEQQHVVFIAQNIGIDFLGDQDLHILGQRGVDVSKIKTDVIGDAYRWGMLSLALGEERAQHMTYDQLHKFIQSGAYLPLTKSQQAGLDLVKHRFTQDVKGASMKMQSDVTNILIQSSNKDLSENAIRDSLNEAIIDNRSVKQFSTSLRERVDVWNRDFDRIADFTSHTAFDYGRAAYLLDQHGEDVKVYKTVYTGACRHCIRIYLTQGIGSPPRLFSLKEIMSNGTNIGVKANEQKAVLGPTHPWCRCTLYHFQEGDVFDEKSGMFMPSTQWKRKVQRRTKIDIKVGDQSYKI